MTQDFDSKIPTIYVRLLIDEQSINCFLTKVIDKELLSILLNTISYHSCESAIKKASGFSVHVGTTTIDPDVVFAKLASLAQGSELAAKRLFK